MEFLIYLGYGLFSASLLGYLLGKIFEGIEDDVDDKYPELSKVLSY